MKVLPVVGRELRVAARRRAAHWSRVAAALLALGVMGWIWLIARDSFFAPTRGGRQLFALLVGVGCLLCLVLGASLTADCLSEEKREGTLGLLFLTDLRGLDVVLGKLSATSLVAIYALVATLPMLSLPLLLGGISTLVLTGAALLLLNTLFFSLTAGLFISAVSRDERRAFSGTASLILGIAAGFPLAAILVQEFSRWPGRGELAQFLYGLSPGYSVVACLDHLVLAVGTITGASFWWSLVFVHVQAWLFLLLACWTLPRTWRDRAPRAVRTGNRGGGWQEWWFGEPRRRLELRRELLGVNPLVWLTCRHRPRVLAPWLGLGGVALVWFAGLLAFGREWLSSGTALLFASLLQSVFKYQVGAEACRRFSQDRRSGALELLLSTPLRPEDIVAGQTRALHRIFLPALAVLLAVEGLLLALSSSDAGADFSELAVLFGAAMSVTALDTFTLVHLGMWNGLRARGYGAALGGTTGWVLCAPWLAFIVSVTTVVAVGWTQQYGGSEGGAFYGLVTWWLVLCVGVDAFWLWRAQAGLRHRFHELATAPLRKHGSG